MVILNGNRECLLGHNVMLWFSSTVHLRLNYIPSAPWSIRMLTNVCHATFRWKRSVYSSSPSLRLLRALATGRMETSKKDLLVGSVRFSMYRISFRFWIIRQQTLSASGIFPALLSYSESYRGQQHRWNTNSFHSACQKVSPRQWIPGRWCRQIPRSKMKEKFICICGKKWRIVRFVTNYFCLCQVESAYRVLQAKYADQQTSGRPMNDQDMNDEVQQYDIQVN